MALSKRVIFIFDAKNRQLFECFYKDLAKIWSACNNHFTAIEGNYYFATFVSQKTTAKMCIIDARFDLILQVLHHFLQTVTIKHCILQHFRVLRLPQKPTDHSSNI